MRETVDLVGTVAGELPVVGAVLHKGANIVTDLYLQERRTRYLLKDAELLEDPIKDLTKVFVEELNHLTDKQVMLNSNRMKRCQRNILFFDTFEQLANEVAPWLLDHFLPANISTNVVIIIAGRDSIERSTPGDPKRWLQYRDTDIIYLVNLDSFTEEETRAYLTERGITDPGSISTIWQLSRGLPLYLGLLTFNLQGNIDPTADVVANFLRWIPEQEHLKRRVALDAALFSRPFNQDDLAAFPYLQEDDERGTLYNWLIRLPFVRNNPQDGRHRYHELAQDLFRRDLYQRSQKEYYATRRALAVYYQQVLEQTQREETRKTGPTAEYLELSLALAYQLSYLPDEASHIEGIECVLNAYRNTNSEQVKEFIRFLRDISSEQQNSKMGASGLQTARQLLQLIEARAESKQQELIESVSDLIKKVAKKPAHSSALVGWLFEIRGHAYRDLKEYRRAIADYDRAIELDPTDASHYGHRGLNYLWLNDIDQAKSDYIHSWELDSTLVNCGWMAEWSRMCQKRADPGVAEQLEAIAAVDSQIYVSFVCRGVALWIREHFHEALAELDLAIPLDPEEWDAYFWKGMAYASLGQDEEAFTALKQALTVGLPPVLLSPLSWLQQDKPAFYSRLSVTLADFGQAALLCEENPPQVRNNEEK